MSYRLRGSGYCSEKCRKEFFSKIASITMSNTNKKYASERMKKNNPMFREESLNKMKASMAGRTFLSRGGNGQLTKQQQKLSELTQLIMEYPISVKNQMSLEKSLPKCYKVDLAHPETKLAVEVDGKTHQLKRWKYLDKRKMAVLKSLGWTILRFTNQQVDKDPQKIAKKIMSTISKLQETTTTSQALF
jgi:very-short-patch-repair endonuclease